MTWMQLLVYVDHVAGFELIAARYQMKGQIYVVATESLFTLHAHCLLLAIYIRSWPDSYAEGSSMSLKSCMLSKKSNKKLMQIILEILEILQDQITNCIYFWFHPLFVHVMCH